MANLDNQLLGIKTFFSKTIWKMDLSSQPLHKKLYLYPLKVITMMVHNILRTDIYLQASGLTYYTLLAIVPTVALAFGIAKGFGLSKFIQKQINKVLGPYPEVAERVMEFAENMLNTTSGGAIAGIGLLFLLYTIIILLNRIEITLNTIWMAEKPRPIVRKITENVTVIFLAPIIIILSAGANVALTNSVEYLTESYQFFAYIGKGLTIVLSLVPLFLLGVLMSTIYLIFPNTNVKIGPGLIGGFIAALIYLVVQAVYVNFQVGVSRYNAIYGSLAGLPLFLAWVQISWLVLLFGAQLSFAVQHIHVDRPTDKNNKISSYMRKIFAIGFLHKIVQKFKQEELPTQEWELTKLMGVPHRFTVEMVDDLCEAGLIAKVLKSKKKEDNSDEEEIGWQPAIETEKITLKEVYMRLEKLGRDDDFMVEEATSVFLKMKQYIDNIHQRLDEENESVRLDELNMGSQKVLVP